MQPTKTQQSVASKLANVIERPRDNNGNSITEIETSNGLVKLSPETVRMYLVNGNGAVTGQEIQMFIALCKYQKLNPFLREAYLIKYGNQPATMVVGKDTFIRRAAVIEDCDGYEAGVVVRTEAGVEYREGALVLSDEKLVGGWATVYRKSRQRPTKITLGFDEYVGRKNDGEVNQQWRVKPGTMIRKVALVQALREAFPSDYMGMYSPEERNVDEVLPEAPAVDPIQQQPEPAQAEKQAKQKPVKEEKPEPQPEPSEEQEPVDAEIVDDHQPEQSALEGLLEK